MSSGSEAYKSIKKLTRRRLAFGVNTALSLLLATVVFGMVNYLSYRHYKRTDWSKSGYYTLSDKTTSLLASLSNEIDVVVFFQPDHEVFEDVDNLLKEYEAATPMLRVERIDPNRDPGRAEQLAARFDVKDMNVVVFDYRGRSKFINASEILEMDYSEMLQGGEPKRKGFKGEQAFSSAILNVTQERKPVVYFLRGHGERDLENRDPYAGFSTLKQYIVRENVDVRTVAIGEVSAIPADADAVVIAGPSRRYAQVELDILLDYLDAEGRLLVMLDASTDTGIEIVLKDWGISVGSDVIIDPTRTISGIDLFVNEYGGHPVTRGLGGITCLFYLPRSVAPLAGGTGADRADKPQVTPLCWSSEGSWAESDIEQKPMRFDADRDEKGPMPIAVASERGPVAELDVDIRPTRLVVFGDSDFVSNSPMTGGNFDLFLGALNWLLERESLLAISPKPPDEARLLMDATQLNMLFWVVVLGLPGIVGSLGILMWLKRRV